MKRQIFNIIFKFITGLWLITLFPSGFNAINMRLNELYLINPNVFMQITPLIAFIFGIGIGLYYIISAGVGIYKLLSGTLELREQNEEKAA